MEKKHVFTPNEKKLFLSLRRKYSHIIENKDTDGASLKKKNATWERLTAEFNSSPIANSMATKKQLRRLWVNLKQRQREELAKRRQSLPTEDDPPINGDQIDPLSMLSVGINSGIDSHTVQGNDNPETEVTLASGLHEHFRKCKPPEMEVSSIDGKCPISISIEEVDVEQKPMIPMDDHEYSNLYDQEIKPTSTTPRPSIPSTAPPLHYTYRSTSQPFHPSKIQTTTHPPSTFRTAQPIRTINKHLLEREYKDNLLRATEKHNLEMQILREQLRESKAKADLAELILKHKLDSFDETTTTN